MDNEFQKYVFHVCALSFIWLFDYYASVSYDANCSNS